MYYAHIIHERVFTDALNMRGRAGSEPADHCNVISLEESHEETRNKSR